MPGMLGTARRLRRSQPSAGGCSVKHKPVLASVHVGRSVRRARELGCRCVAAETDSALAGSDAPSDEVDTGSSRGLPIVQQEVREEDVLRVPTLRDSLEPRPSPFCVNNNRGGGCAHASHLVTRVPVAVSPHWRMAQPNAQPAADPAAAAQLCGHRRPRVPAHHPLRRRELRGF